MTFNNEGQADRGVRMLAGLVLLSAAWMVSFSMLGIVLFAFGATALATGLVGWCPAYTLFGVSTLKTPAGHCPNCDTANREVRREPGPSYN